jgi:hypothetical protein
VVLSVSGPLFVADPFLSGLGILWATDILGGNYLHIYLLYITYICISERPKSNILSNIYAAVAFPLIMAVIFTYSESSKRKNGYLILIFAISSATVTFWYVYMNVYI